MAKETECAACGATVFHQQGHFRESHQCAMNGKPSGDNCPKCGTGLVYKPSRYNMFRACPGYPTCDGKLSAPRGRSFSSTPSKSPSETPNPEVSKMPVIETPIKTPKDMSNEAASAANALWALIGPAASLAISALVSEEIQKIAKNEPRETVWKTPEGLTIAKLDGKQHKDAARVLDLIRKGFLNILLVGPAGSGKSTIPQSVAKALGRPFGFVSMSGGASEGVLTGRAIPNLTTGQTEYQSTQFVEFYENGGVFCVDEIDAADPNALITINAALANGHLPLGNRIKAPVAKRHADTVLICTANTYGHGADRMYAGRNQLDAATLNRFTGATLTVDYDKDLERTIVNGAPQADSILDRVWEIRRKATELKLRRIVGTRDVIAVAKHVAGGETIHVACKAVFGDDAGWTADEQSKIGVR